MNTFICLISSSCENRISEISTDIFISLNTLDSSLMIINLADNLHGIQIPNFESFIGSREK